MEELAEQKYRTRNLVPLGLLILVFALPMAIGWFLYLNPEVLEGSQSVNGSLIQPPRSLNKIVLNSLDSEKYKFQDRQGMWIMMLAVKGECNADCKRWLVDMQMIRRAVGRDHSRVQSLLVLESPEYWSDKHRQGISHNKIKTAFESGVGKPFLSSVFSLIDNQVDAAIFIIDPMGNLMLSYSDNPQAIEIHEDLKQLLTATKNWNRGCAVCPAIN